MSVLSLQNPLSPQLDLRHYLPNQGFRHIYPVHISLNSSKCQLNNYPSVLLRCYRCFRYSINANASGVSDADSSSPTDIEGSLEEDKSPQRASLSSTEILKKLKRYGVSGILAYGLLNTAYYLTTFLLVWFYIAPGSGKMGYMAAVQRFLKLMAMVWAGSQVTKLLRAGGALALAPFVDKGLSWFTIKYKFESQGKAFMAIVGLCFGLALVLFLTVTLLSA